jgi:23S rRNA pseudouridine1911/1915/1917 synthase
MSSTGQTLAASDLLDKVLLGEDVWMGEDGDRLEAEMRRPGVSSKHVWVVTGGEAAVSLEELLERRLSLARATARDWIAGGSVYVDGRRSTHAEAPLRAGQQIVAHVPPATDEPPADPEVAYRDAELVVLDKPAGLPSVPTRSGGTPTLEAFVRRELGSGARLLHRLDREVSGLVLVSVHPRSRKMLVDQIRGHEAVRCYLALATGCPSSAELTIRSRLSVRAGRSRSSEDPRAREAETQVRLIRRLGDRSLLEVELRTGRTHQIRAHLSENGLPILGDERYGGPRAARVALHAHRLRFRHPDGGWLDLHSPLSEVLRNMLGS